MNNSKSRRVFEPSFKLQIAQKLKIQGLSIGQVCIGMSVAATAVKHWLAQFEAKHSWGKARRQALDHRASAHSPA